MERESIFQLIFFILAFCPLHVGGLQVLTKEIEDDGTEAIKQLSIMLKVRSGESFKDGDMILQRGVTNSKWRPKCGVLSFEPCWPKTFDKYMDEITMEFTYTNASLFNFSSPIMSVTGGRARPVVAEFSYEDGLNNGEITVWHRCELSPVRQNDMSRVTMSFQIRDDTVVLMSWQKECGSGEHERVDYGYYADRTSLNRGVIMLSLKGSAELTSELVRFGPRLLSTRLYMRLLKGAHSQRFMMPKISVHHGTAGHESADEKHRLDVELRGATQGGIMKEGAERVFDILYSCRGGGLWRVHVEVAIAPFEEIEMEWLKDCGGGTEYGVHVANEPNPMYADIVRDGVTMPAYSLLAGGPPKRRSRYNAVWGQGEGNKIFFLIVDGRAWKVGEGGIAIGEITAHSEDERIGVARMGRPADSYSRIWSGFKSVSENGEIVTHRVRRLLRIQVDCLRRGWLRVAVRISVRDRDDIKWWFWNQCNSKKTMHKEIFPPVANTPKLTLWLLILVALISLKRTFVSARKAVALHTRYKGFATGFRTVYPDEVRRTE